jgi:hypothetical protein
MITYETAKRLALVEKNFETLKATNERALEMESRGALGWGGKGSALGKQEYLARILPALKAMADSGDEDGLVAALDAENFDEPQETLSKTIRFRILPSEKEAFEKYAANEKKNVSDVLREFINSKISE